MGKWINSLTAKDVEIFGGKFRGLFKTADGDTVLVRQFENMWGQRVYELYTDFDVFSFWHKSLFPAYSNAKLAKIISKWSPDYKTREDDDFYVLSRVFTPKTSVGDYQSEKLQHEEKVQEILAKQKEEEIKAKDEMLNEYKRKFGIKR